MPMRPKTHKPAGTAARKKDVRRAYEKKTREAGGNQAQARTIRSSQRWKHLRALQLADHPLCANPYRLHPGVYEACEVDHIVPLAVDASTEAAFDRDNLQSLCERCHARKTADDQRRSKLRALAERGSASRAAGEAHD